MPGQRAWVHPEAIAEARAAREWYETRKAEVAEAFMAELDWAIERIEEADVDGTLSGGRGKTMSKVDKLKAEIERLPREEFTELVRWVSEKDWERWDKEIEADSEAGKLDFLVREALDEKAKGTLKDL